MHWNRARATLGLAGLMVAAFVVQIASCATTSNRSEALVDLGAIVPGTLQRGEFLRLVAALFLHAGVLHLAFNLWAFVQVGYAWETLFGARRFLATFFLTGLAASVCSAMFVKPPGAVGASGAIFGLMSALVVLLARAPAWRTAAWTRVLGKQLAIWASITLLVAFFSPQIDNAAHLGGLLAGLIVGSVMPAGLHERAQAGSTTTVSRY